MLTVNCPCCGKELDIVPEGDYHEITCDDCHLSMWQHKAEEIISVCNQKQAELDRLKAVVDEIRKWATSLDENQIRSDYDRGYFNSATDILAIIDKEDQP